VDGHLRLTLVAVRREFVLDLSFALVYERHNCLVLLPQGMLELLGHSVSLLQSRFQHLDCRFHPADGLKQ